MNHGSLFSGIGGFDLAAEWRGWNNVFHCEKDAKARAVLHKNFPDVISHEDIFELDATQYKGQIDIITGGFPCQPFSLAGKRRGRSDDRYLWPQMLRVIRECQPSFVVGENVFGLTNMENGETFDAIWSSLEDEGYTVEPFILPASAVQAWHRRDRVWIIAYGNNSGKRTPTSETKQKWQKGQQGRNELTQSKFSGYGKNGDDPNAQGGNESRQCDERQRKGQYRRLGCKQNDPNATDTRTESMRGWENETPKNRRIKEDVADTNGERSQESRESRRSMHQKQGSQREINRAFNDSIWSAEPNVGRVVNGLPGRMDRLKQLGNAIVPQVAYEIFGFIEQIQSR